MNKNQQGLTFVEWLNAAEFGDGDYTMVDMLEAWRHGENPTEYLKEEIYKENFDMI